jgi:hypothetical protein
MPVGFCLFIAYLLAPKISLISSGEAGVRPEDFIAAIAAAYYLAVPRLKPIKIPPYLWVYGVFIAFAFFSSAVNHASNGVTGFVFTLRLIEYLIWFFIIYDCSDKISYKSSVKWFYITSIILIMWGWLEYFGLISKVGRFAVVESRLSLNTSGPFETSIMLAALAYVTPQLVLTPLLLALVWLTQARITVVGGLFSLLTRRPSRGVPIAIGGLLIGAVLIGPVSEILGASRFADTASPVAMAQTLTRTYRQAQTFTDAAAYRAQFSDTLSGFGGYFHLSDPGASFNLRAVRWSIIVKSTIHGWTSFLVGFSPGAWGLAVDGFYVREFGETGLIGLSTFVVFLTMMLMQLRRNSSASFLLVMLIVVAFFIDIFSSSKAVPMLWAFAALDLANHPLAVSATAKRLLGWERYCAMASTEHAQTKLSPS